MEYASNRQLAEESEKPGKRKFKISVAFYIVIRGIFGTMTRILAWLRLFRPEPISVDWRERLRGSAGALLGLLVTGVISKLALKSDYATLLLLAPMGASAVLLYAVPASPLAQPWSIVGGNLLSGFIGITCGRLIPDPIVAAAIAGGISIGAMFAFRCLHPPSGAIALTVVLGSPAIHDLGYGFLAAPLGLNTLLLVGTALLFHNLSGHRYPRRSAVSPAFRFGLHPEDLDEILDHQSELLDIGRDDLLALFNEMERLVRLRERQVDASEGIPP